MKLGQGIVDDLRARAPWYWNDWKEGFGSGYRILAPSVYIFFASVIPGLAFGEQIEHDTNGAFNGAHVLVSTAIGGVVQSFFGGQPLLILGVAEPIVLMYGFMYKFAEARGFQNVFVPWCTWVTIWTAGFMVIIAVSGMCQLINKFTRFSGELFGMLIAILFMQQAVKGIVQEFKVERCPAASVDGGQPLDCVEYDAVDKLVSGLWACILSIGTVVTSMHVRHARCWRFFKGGIRSFLADYGVPVMVLAWSAFSYAPQGVTPEGVPRRLSLPNTWDPLARGNWNVLHELGQVTGVQVAYAAIPALIIALLFFFDHNVSAQLAQQQDFQLVRPTAYNWDFILCAILMVASGFMGIPPPNCVIPQAPMHTKSLMVLKQMLVERNAGRKSQLDLKGMDQKTASQLALSSLAAVPADQRKSVPNLQAAAAEAGVKPSVSVGSGLHNAAESHADSLPSEGLLAKHGLEREYFYLEDGVVPLNVKEQRLSNLLQSLLVAVCLAATPAVKRIPKSVLWGYFAFMSLESLPGSEFWDRILLIFTDKRKRVLMLEKEHPVYLETVRFYNVMRFTALQILLLGAVWAVTWAGAVGIAFPFLIVLLIPARQYVMPRFFDKWTLSQLDSAEYEEAPPAPDWVVREVAQQQGALEADASETVAALDAEMPGFSSIKHHVTHEELSRRRLSLAQSEAEAADIRTQVESLSAGLQRHSTRQPQSEALAAGSRSDENRGELARRVWRDPGQEEDI